MNKEGASSHPSRGVGKASLKAKAGTRPGGGTGRRNKRRQRKRQTLHLIQPTSFSWTRLSEGGGGLVLPPQGLQTTPILAAYDKHPVHTCVDGKGGVRQCERRSHMAHMA